MVKVNDEVVRVKGAKYNQGDRGTVVELNEVAGRARVYWIQKPWGLFVRDDETREYILNSRYETLEKAEKAVCDLYDRGETSLVRYSPDGSFYSA